MHKEGQIVPDWLCKGLMGITHFVKTVGLSLEIYFGPCLNDRTLIGSV